MIGRGAIAGIIVIPVLAVLGYFVWHYVDQRSAQSCRACLRPVHSHMRTVALVDGKRVNYCCPACAVSEREQSGKPVQVVELTDYPTDTPIKPEGSYVVRNSDINPCLQHQPAVGQDNQPLESHFDRCNPSVLAFADRQSAETFARRHGGEVMQFAAFASRPRQ